MADWGLVGAPRWRETYSAALWRLPGVVGPENVGSAGLVDRETYSVACFDAEQYDSANLLAWYSPNLGMGLGHGDTVTTWSDKQGTHNLDTTSGTITFETDYFPTKMPAVKFAASAYITATTELTLGTDFTVYAVVQRASATSSGVSGVVEGAAGTNDRFRLRHASGQLEGVVYNTALGTESTSDDADPDETTPNIVTLVNDAGVDTKVYEDNVQMGDGTGYTSTNTATTLGVNKSGTDYPSMVSYYGDIAIYNSAHDATTRTAIYDSLYATYIDSAIKLTAEAVD